MKMHTQHGWPGWETMGLIGRGSFGTVFKIQRDVLGEVEEAALKVISIPQNDGDIEEMYNDGYDDESITSTFQAHLKSIVSEYSLMRKMNGSTNIVNCDDIRYIQHGDGPGWDIYIKMELLTPLTKAAMVDISEETVIKIAKDMCAALEMCNEYNIVHRDIKPQNIFVSKRGDYKLGDFGIAKTVEKTMGGTKIGTYKYMAPEVYNNQPYNAAADIYSLGLVLYWLLNEHRMPFLPLPPEKLSAGMENDARNRRMFGERIPEPKNGSKALKQIVLKACEYRPEDRFASAHEMLDALSWLSCPKPEKANATENAVHSPDETIQILPTPKTDSTASCAQSSDKVPESQEMPAAQPREDIPQDPPAAKPVQSTGDKTPPYRLISMILVGVCLCLVLLLFFRDTPSAKDAVPEQTAPPTVATNTQPPATEVPSVTEPKEYTSIYVTVFDSTMVLSGTPITEYDGQTITAESRLMSDSATCKGYTGNLEITKAVILDSMAPTSTVGWFSEMTELTEIEGLNKLNMEHVTDISYMFYRCEKLTSLENLSSWDTSNVKSMTYVFAYCKALPSVSGLDSWDVSNVESMLEFFRDCNSLTSVGNLGRWDVGNCQNFNAMFGNCFKLNSVGDLSAWDMSSAIDLGYMFDDCQVLKSPGKLDNWDVRNVVSITYMFCNCKKLATVGNLDSWNLQSLQNQRYMFAYCKSIDRLPRWI